MTGTDDRTEDIPTGVPQGFRRPKALVVTRSVPGHDAGFAKSGHAHYLQTFIDDFCRRGFDTVLVVLAPRVDFLSMRRDALTYRVLSPAFLSVGSLVVVRDGRAVLSVLTWQLYARAPRPVQQLASGLRSLVRRARGFVHVLGTDLADTDRAFVRAAVEREHPDVIVYDGIFNACGRLRDVDHWVLTHEVKHQRAESFAQHGVRVKPASFSRETERAVLSDAGNVIAIHWDDREELRRLAPAARIVVVPVAMEVTGRARTRPAVPGRCIFVGSGSFHNVDGMRWFLDCCWAGIRAALPTATLDIFGTIGYRLGKLPAGVTGHGVAVDLTDAYADASLAIVPLQIGSGLKVKLVEALAHGMPVVTTPVGAQGLMSFTPPPFIVAESAAAFIDACVHVLSDQQRATALATAAQTCARQFSAEAAFAEFAASTAAGDERVGLVRVCIAIPTCGRPESLSTLLGAIAALSIDRSVAHVEVALFDNDPRATAAPIASHWRERFPFALHYEVVSEPGLAMVRNRSLAFALGRYDYIAMIDDDEIPEAHWLGELLRVARRSGADVVVGPVFPVLPPGAPMWMHSLRARETPLLPDGTSLRDGWTCNALVATKAAQAQHVRFDPALNFAGGEDQLFFRQMRAGGSTIVFAASAIVRESLAADRLSVRFNLLRSFRRGNSLAFCERRMNPAPLTFTLRLCKALATIARALARVPLHALRGETSLVLCACDVANGCGMLAGLFGKLYSAYGRSA